MTERTFRRYTNLAAAIHMLRTRRITLLNPATWDDRNDAHFMAEYKRHRRAVTVLALCFAEQVETYHHWRIFAPGVDGVCIEFEKFHLIEMFGRDPRIVHDKVKYFTLKKIKSMKNVNLQLLPFMKRYPYGHEGEYRVVFVDPVEKHDVFDFEIDLTWINHITLSPWMAPSLADSIRTTLKSFPGCQDIRMHQSTLISNDEWKTLTNRVILPGA